MIIWDNIPFLEGNFYLTLFLNLLVYLLILVALPLILMGFLALVKNKPKTNQKSNSLIYMYAFSTGMFLMIGTFGFMREGFETAKRFTHGEYANFSSEFIRTLVVVAILGISSLIGFMVVIGGRYLFVKSSKVELHKAHEEHSHSDHLISFKDIDNPKAAWLAILMLLSHRIVDGYFIGYAIFKIIWTRNTFSSFLMLLITFTIHILFEIAIVYFRQIQYGEKKSKAILYNFLTFLLIIPFVFLGAFTGRVLSGNLEWIQASILTMGGSIILFTSVFELIPEFIHIRNKNPKILYLTLITFAFSIVLTIMLLSFHSHI
ncbi:ZIP family metal transporter [Metamycoplasma alkalescens]|nr:ZIP family metal transporter [Metamycoplasma alkalescens]PYF43592.1 ZIP zinc transporter [Metamycoplasma alkalescens]